LLTLGPVGVCGVSAPAALSVIGSTLYVGMLVDKPDLTKVATIATMDFGE